MLTSVVNSTNLQVYSKMQFLITLNCNGKFKTLPQITCVLVSCLAGVSRGLIFGWTSPAIPTLIANPHLNISLEEASYFTILFPIAMAVSVPLVFLMEGIGRKATILLLAVPQLLSWITILVANSIWIFYMSRIIAGVADAIYYAVLSVYVCEITQPHIRGLWGPVASISAYLGIFLMNIIGSYYSIQTTALVCSFLPIFQFVLFWFMPESPYFLLKKGDETGAKNSLNVLGWSDNLEDEFALLKLDVERQLSESGTFKQLFTIKSNRKALLLCIMLRCVQQLSGLSAFETYTQYMFQQAGTDISEKTSSIFLTGLSLVSVIVSAYFLESKGRRPLMIFSSITCSMALGTLTFYFILKKFSNLDLQQFNWVPLLDMLIFVVVCSPGLGIIPSLMTGELFSASIKAKAVCVMNTVLAMGYLIVPKLFESLTDGVGIYAPFVLFTSASFLGAIFSYIFLIETKGKTLEEIQQTLKGNKD